MVIAEEQPLPPESAYDEQGVDRSLIWEMLELSPIERVRRLDDMVAGILEIRALNRDKLG
jgi:hypothetical protein